MDNEITFRLSKEKLAQLDAVVDKKGYASRGKAVEAIVEKRLSLDEEYDYLGSRLDRIEERVVKEAWLGTKASLASLCLQSAMEDDAMKAKLDAMPAGKVFDYAWDMAETLVAHGDCSDCPDFYEAAKINK